MKYKVLIITVIVCYLMANYGCGSNTNSSSNSDSSSDKDSIVNVEIGYNIKINYTDSGFLRAVIKAPKMVGHSNSKTPKTEMPDGLVAIFYTNDMVMDSKLKANYGIHYQTKKMLYVKDSVSIVNYKNETLFTDDLWWDQVKELIYTESKVKVTTPNQVIYGKGLTANQNFSKWVIKNITGVVKISAVDTTAVQ